MADAIPVVEFRGEAVIAKYRGLPEKLRARMRAEIPGLTRELAGRVRAKLQPGALGMSAQTGLPLFAHTNRLLPAVTARMVENSQAISGRVYIDPAKFPAVAGLSLEGGARAHVIEARNAPALVFYWPKIGGMFVGKRVHHPGVPGWHFLANSLAEMRDKIATGLGKASADEVRK